MIAETEELYRGLDNLKPTRPMTDEESQVFIKLTMARMKLGDRKTKQSLADEFDRELSDDPIVSIMLARIERNGLKWRDVAETEMLIMSTLIEPTGRPGMAVMWAYTLLLWSTELGAPVSIEDFAEKLYPWGVPTVDAMETAWDAQKGHALKLKKVDNGLDTPTLWEPLIAKRLEQLKPAEETPTPDDDE